MTSQTAGTSASAACLRPGASWICYWATLAVASIGLVLTGYLAIAALGRGTVAGCGAGSACDMAMSSAWAWWLGVPVSALAMALYGLVIGSIAVAMVGNPRVRQWAWTILLTLALMLVGAAGWFVYVLLFRIGAICPFCTATHALGLATAGFIVIGALTGPKRNSDSLDRPAAMRAIGSGQWGLAVILATAGLATLIGVQTLRPTSTYAMVNASTLDQHPQHQAEDSHEDHDHGHEGHGHDHNTTKSGDSELLASIGDFYRIRDGQRVVAPAFTDIVLNPYELPIMGSPDAEHLLVFFFDYTCGACRNTHQMLRYAHQQYGDQIGVLFVTTPNSGTCNPLFAEWGVAGSESSCKYARLGLALWRVSPGVFDRFDIWLANFRTVPPLDVGVKQAIELAGRERLEAALADSWIEQKLQQYVQFGRPVMEHFRGTPVILMGHQFVQGIPDNPEEFCRMLEDELGLTRKSSK